MFFSMSFLTGCRCLCHKEELLKCWSAQAPLVIHTPHALPLFREDKPGGKRKREKDRMDPIKSRAPERGSAADLGVGTGGKIGVTGGTLLTQYILKNQVGPPPHLLCSFYSRCYSVLFIHC